MDNQQKIRLAEELLKNWADGLLGSKTCLDALANTFLSDNWAGPGFTARNDESTT